MRSAFAQRSLLIALAPIAALAVAALAGASTQKLILPTHTPGARYSKVTQATISSTICVRGWTATIRPPASYTNALKRAQLATDTELKSGRPRPRGLRLDRV